MSMKSQAIADGSVKLRWREPYVTDGVDTALMGIPHGMMRGFWIEELSPVGQGFRLTCASSFGEDAGVADDNFAMYRDARAASGYALAIHEAADVVIDLSTDMVWPPLAEKRLWVWIDVQYAPNVATVATYRVENGVDPRIANPAALVIGRLNIYAGATTVDLHGASPTAEVLYGDRQVPSATARRTQADYVAGDNPWGLVAGTDLYRLPSLDQRDALFAAGALPSSANKYVTEEETTRTVWGEPRVASGLTVAAGVTYKDMSFATYGAVYVGLGALGTAQDYFDVRATGTDRRWTRDAVAGDASAVVIDKICRYGGAVEINPAADADAAGFWSGGIRVYFDAAYSATTTGTFDIWYARKQTFATLDQTPAAAMPVGFRGREGHADLTGAQRWWAPARGELAPTVTVQDQLNKLARVARGTNNLNQGEYYIAAKLFGSDTTDALPYGGACQQTLGAANWPYCFAYGFNDVGAVDGLAGGERFFLFSRTVTGRERVVRYRIADDGVLLAHSEYIDPVPTLAVAPWLGVPMADWRIVSMASTGRYLVIRLAADDGGGNMHHALHCYDITTRTEVWAAPVDLTGGLGPMPQTLFDVPEGNSMHVIIADGTRVAINRNWNDTLSDPCIATYLLATGALDDWGNGNADDLGSPPYSWADVYAAGPMVSDGDNIYFTTRTTASDIGYFGIAQCTIAAPAASQVNATVRAERMTPWSPGYPGQEMEAYPRSLVFDGRLVWLSTTWAIMVLNPVVAGGAIDAEGWVMNPTGWSFGPMAFDGKALWFGMADISGDNTVPIVSEHWVHLVRLNPAELELEITSMAYPTESTGGNLSLMVPRDKMWAMMVPFTSTSSFSWGQHGLSFGQPFGPILFDGDSLYWTVRNWHYSGMGSSAWCTQLQRKANVHGV